MVKSAFNSLAIALYRAVDELDVQLIWADQIEGHNFWDDVTTDLYSTSGKAQQGRDDVD